MALPYFVRQDTRRNGSGMWYGQATHWGIVTLDDLAEKAQRNCSLKKSDCLGINHELLETLRYELTNGACVYLNKFGYFKPSIQSSGALTEDKYSAAEHIKGLKVNFVAAYTLPKSITGENKKALREFTHGVEFKKVPEALWKKKPENP